MRLLITAFSALAISLLSFTSIDLVSVPVNVEQSSVEWKASKVTGKHNGSIKLKEGNLSFENDTLTGGSFTIDMSTLECLDLEGGAKGKLEGHLQSPDFFGVAEFPTAQFVIKKVIPRGTPGDYKIVGDITIKGATKEIKFNTLLKDGKASANIILDRTDFNVRYGSGSFFSNLGDNTIYDEFELNIALAYTK